MLEALQQGPWIYRDLLAALKLTRAQGDLLLRLLRRAGVDYRFERAPTRYYHTRDPRRLARGDCSARDAGSRLLVLTGYETRPRSP
jgi:hypothetical protein